MPTPPISPAAMEPFTTALRHIQDQLFTASLPWHNADALACYHAADAALDVACQLLAGTLAPSEQLAKTLNDVLLDETPLPWIE